MDSLILVTICCLFALAKILDYLLREDRTLILKLDFVIQAVGKSFFFSPLYKIELNWHRAKLGMASGQESCNVTPCLNFLQASLPESF